MLKKVKKAKSHSFRYLNFQTTENCVIPPKKRAGTWPAPCCWLDAVSDQLTALVTEQAVVVLVEFDGIKSV